MPNSLAVIDMLEPDTLHLDLQNPRIAEFDFKKNTSEVEIIKVLWEAMGVEEIVLSIKASGFFAHEPLIAVEEDSKIVVIEGNRRLAAVKCILHPDLLDINRNKLTVTSDVLNTLKKLPVIVEKNRKDAWKFIGFKHINGPAKWGSYAKAQYISQVHKSFGIPLADIAVQIGDTHKTVQKLYQSLQVIEQAEQYNKFDRSDIIGSRLYFSHLYTGLTYEGFREFTGINGISEEQPNPVPKEKLENVEDLLIWLFGSKKRDKLPIIQSQNPDLRRLDAVLKSDEALHALKNGYPLVTAYEHSKPKDETFEQSLIEAKFALQKAHSYQSEAFDGSSIKLLNLAGSIAEIADELYRNMESKHDALQEKNKEQKGRRFTE